MRTIRMISVVIALSVVSACGGFDRVAAYRPPLTVSGSISVPGERVDGGWTECVAEDGYDDIAQGAQVTVTDQDGRVLAVSELDAGAMPGGDSGRCLFTFTVSPVPSGQRLYGIHVGNDHRGVMRYTADQLSHQVALTIG